MIVASLSNHEDDYEPATLAKDQWTKSEEEKLRLALKKMTVKSNIDNEDRKMAIEVFKQYRDVFSLPGDQPTLTHELMVSIDTSDAKPDRYISYQRKQHRQEDRFFFAGEFNIK
uniref:Uncharacterized protein n=1 Tax=Romanomermis culicivorax TaxID=13658 RepID=A0A915I2T9_ROMCU